MTVFPPTVADRKIPTHPDWLFLLGEGIMHPDLCFLTSMAVGHLVMLAGIDRNGHAPAGVWPEYLCEWHEWERKPVGHSRRGEAFWDRWCLRPEAYQDTPERACLAYVIAYRAWLQTHPETP